MKIVADVHEDAGFTTLTVQAEHLAPPDRLGDGTVFVVWTKDDKPKWHRVAALKYDTGSRKGSLEGARHEPLGPSRGAVTSWRTPGRPSGRRHRSPPTAAAS